MYYIHILIYNKFLDSLILRGSRRSFVLTTYYTPFFFKVGSPAVLHLATRDHNPTVLLLVSCATYNAHPKKR